MPTDKIPVYLSLPAMSSALGSGLKTHLDALFAAGGTDPLTVSDRWVKGKSFVFGEVREPLRCFDADLDAALISRNNRLLWHALEQIEDRIETVKARYGAHRVAVVMGTSTSGADENINLFRHVASGGAWYDYPFRYRQQLMASPAEFAAEVYGLGGLRYAVSTACTSGARALISAARLLRAGLCDAVVCGGVDTLSPLTINGFASLDVLSRGVAQPFSKGRDGINIGEAAAVFVMTREALFSDGLALLGYGAGSDAYHMSSPHPEGKGAAAAFSAALRSADMAAEGIGWINLHGTGTEQNDAMESAAVAAVFGCRTLCTSTKPLTGHTLGAAGALEAAILWGVSSRIYNPEGRLPPQRSAADDTALPQLAFTGVGSRWPEGRRVGASASFAFGGSNAVLLIGEEA